MDSNRHTAHNLLETRLPLQNSRGQTWNRKTAYQTWKLHQTCCLFASKPPQYDLHRLWRQPFGQHSNDHCGWFAKKKTSRVFQDLTVYLQGKWGNTMHCLVLDRFVVFDPRITCPPPSHWVLFGVPMRLAFKFADEPHLEPESLRSECQLIYLAHLPNWFFIFQVCNGFNFRDVKTILFLLWSLFARGNGNITSMHGTNCSAWSTAQEKYVALSDWARIIHSPLQGAASKVRLHVYTLWFQNVKTDQNGGVSACKTKTNNLMLRSDMYTLPGKRPSQSCVAPVPFLTSAKRLLTHVLRTSSYLHKENDGVFHLCKKLAITKGTTLFIQR